MKIFLPASLLLLFFLTSAAQAKTFGPERAGFRVRTDSFPAAAVTYHIFRSTANTYGYDIYVHDKLMIHQACIPCVQGQRGFASEQDAGKVAGLVVKKAIKGIMPPTVTIEEMRSLGVDI